MCLCKTHVISVLSCHATMHCWKYCIDLHYVPVSSGTIMCTYVPPERHLPSSSTSTPRARAHHHHHLHTHEYSTPYIGSWRSKRNPSARTSWCAATADDFDDTVTGGEAEHRILCTGCSAATTVHGQLCSVKKKHEHPLHHLPNGPNNAHPVRLRQQ